MGVLGDSWCFCNGGGKSERTKASIFSGKASAMATISTAGLLSGTGFLIHRNLLLTPHAVLPSVAAAEAAEIRLHNGVDASLFPHRFFITSSVLDLTIVGLDPVDGVSNVPVQQPHYLKTCSKPAIDLGCLVYVLGYTERTNLTVGEGKVVVATDNLIKVCTDGLTWSPGSAGFDSQGNLSFIICDPMKLATTSPNTKSSSTSSSSTSSWKRDFPTQFGIPIPVISDWLNQHWEGSLDDLVKKTKPPLVRLMSAGQKSDLSSASFTKRRVFKTTEAEEDSLGPGSSHSCQDETPPDDRRTRAQGIPTPEIYESPKLTSTPFRNTENAPIQLLDINFPPKLARPAAKKKEVPFTDTPSQRDESKSKSNTVAEAEIVSTGSVNGAESEVSEGQNGYSSDGQTTMYSAETAESRNYPSPKPVGRSQSCVNHNRWGPTQRNLTPLRGTLEKQQSFVQNLKGYSQGAVSQRSNDYYSPTVSSIMKKRNHLEPPQTHRPRPTAAHTSPKWAF